VARHQRRTQPVDTKYGRLTSYAELDKHLTHAEAKGRAWILARIEDGSVLSTAERCPSDQDILDLHRAMFGDLFDWAGTTRRHDTNIGVPSEQIRIELRKLSQDLQFWVTMEGNMTAETMAAIIARAHHRFSRSTRLRIRTVEPTASSITTCFGTRSASVRRWMTSQTSTTSRPTKPRTTTTKA
jgi:fido (protein-threonine AMPylation protein)